MDGIEQRMFSVESEANEAMRIANEALTRIGLLEQANRNEFERLLKHLSKIEASLDKLFDRFWLIAVAAIGLLLAVSGYLYVESSRVNQEFMMQIANPAKQNNHNEK